MALTERYVTSDSDGGDGSSGNPWTLAEAIAAAAAGDRVNIKSGSYTIAGTTMPSGTVISAIVWRGYNSSIGDLDNQGWNSDGTLNTTNFPDITITTAVMIPGSDSVFQNLDITGAISNALIGSTASDNVNFVCCRVINTQNNSSARCIQGDNWIALINCDFKCTGASHASVVDIDAYCTVYGCRIEGTAAGFLLTCDATSIEDTAFIGNGTNSGHQQLLWSTPFIKYSKCTFYNLSVAVECPNLVAIRRIMFIDCHITDCATVYSNPYSATSEVGLIEVNNRLRDNTTIRDGFESDVLAGQVTTDNGDVSTDFEDAGSGNFFPIWNAAGRNAASRPYTDIGAYQRKEPRIGPRTRSIRVSVNR